MRVVTFAAVAASSLIFASAASACEPLPTECLPRVVVFPAYTPAGTPIGVVEANVVQTPVVQRSRFTGQPITVVYNNPGSAPGAVNPVVELVPLPHAAPARTVGAYPVGY